MAREHFAQGIFALHNGRTSPHPVDVVKWEAIATPLNLVIDTQYWDPRIGAANNASSAAIAVDGFELGTREPV
jgi:hypothetical protein